MMNYFGFKVDTMLTSYKKIAWLLSLYIFFVIIIFSLSNFSVKALFYTEAKFSSEEEINKNILIPARGLNYAAITPKGFLWQPDELLTWMSPFKDFEDPLDRKVRFTNPLTKEWQEVNIISSFPHVESGLVRLKLDQKVTIIEPLALNEKIETAQLVDEDVELVSYGFPVLNQNYRHRQKHLAYTKIDKAEADKGIEITFKKPFSQNQHDSASSLYSAVGVGGDEGSVMLKRIDANTENEKLIVVGLMITPALLGCCEDYGKTATYISLFDNINKNFFEQGKELWSEEIESPSLFRHTAKLLQQKDESDNRRFEIIEKKLNNIVGGPTSACNFTESSSYLEKMCGMFEAIQQKLTPIPEDYFKECSQLSPFNLMGKWELIGGKNPWKNAYKVRGFSVYKDRLFASIDAGLWAYDGGTWESILSFEKEGVNNLITDEGFLYLALSGPQGGMGVYDGNNFSCINKGLNKVSGGIGGYSLCKYKDKFYLGCAPAGVFELVGDTWHKIAGDGSGGSWINQDDAGTVYDLKVYKDKLYAGLARGGYGPVSSSVWCYDGSNWERVGGDGLLGSWSHPHISFVLDLNVYNDLLFASLTRPKTMTGLASSVYAFDGETWFPIGVGRLPHLLSESHINNCMLSFKERLYLATGDKDRCVPAVWELSSCGKKWRQVAGGLNKDGWPYDNQLKTLLGERSHSAWIYKMIEFKDQIYVGMAGKSVGAQVWRYNSN